jgi:NAD-dependent dihydropyrimidine dehydrogenase PreA subunit
MIGAASQFRVVWCEETNGKPNGSSVRAALFSRLLDKGIPVRVRRSPDGIGNSRSTSDEHLLVLGEFDGNVPENLGSNVRDVTGLGVDEILTIVGQHTISNGAGPGGKRWKPWFPVIDYSRCTNCMQCLSFCLFDVYGVSTDGRIQVQHESNCKTDCPACSRVCPEVAIMFPKYKAGPINGDEINSDDLRREAMKVDISALLGGDIYSLLRDRSVKAKSRFSKERDDERALQERQRCLDKLKMAAGGFDVPPEVLASLPSLDQIQAKAAQARQRAAEALEAQAKLQNQSEAQDSPAAAKGAI